ncbi:YceI family protein [Luteimonas pelagia]
MARRVVSRGAVLLLLCAPAAQAADYLQAPGSTLAFAGEYEGEVFTGRFPGFRTTLSFDPAAPAEARLAVTIPLAGVDTDSRDRDDTLRGRDFFDAARFPEARYEAAGVQALGGGRYRADGTLTLRGVSLPVPLEFTWSAGPRPVLQGRATVSRLAFGIGGGDWADTGVLPDAIAVSTRVVFAPARPD